jgi:hypothetical protein
MCASGNLRGEHVPEFQYLCRVCDLRQHGDLSGRTHLLAQCHMRWRPDLHQCQHVSGSGHMQAHSKLRRLAVMRDRLVFDHPGWGHVRRAGHLHSRRQL